MITMSDVTGVGTERQVKTWQREIDQISWYRRMIYVDARKHKSVAIIQLQLQMNESVRIINVSVFLRAIFLLLCRSLVLASSFLCWVGACRILAFLTAFKSLRRSQKALQTYFLLTIRTVNCTRKLRKLIMKCCLWCDVTVSLCCAGMSMDAKNTQKTRHSKLFPIFFFFKCKHWKH